MNFNDKKTRENHFNRSTCCDCRDGGNDDYPLYDGLE